MKHFCILKFAAACVLACACFVYVSCATEAADGTTGTDTASDESGKPLVLDDPWYTQNIPTLSVLSLSNGIRVCIKNEPSFGTATAKLVILGSSVFVPSDKAGIEGITLACAARGSLKDPPPEFGEYASRAMGAFTITTGYDYSTFDVTALEESFEAFLASWADRFASPRLDQKGFEAVRAERLDSAKRLLSSPSTLAGETLSKRLLAGTPYESDPDGTPESLASLTLDDVVKCHASMLDASRIAVVVIGNVDAERVLAILEPKLGTIASSSTAIPEAVSYRPAGAVGTQVSSKPGTAAFAKGMFTLPEPGHRDWGIMRLAVFILNENLAGNCGRTDSPCFSVKLGFKVAKAPFGIVSIDRAADLNASARLFFKAAELLASGSCVVSGKTVPLGDAMEMYKSKYIVSRFSRAGTSAVIAALVAEGLVFSKDPSEYLKTADRIEAVDARGISRVIKEWVLGSVIDWEVVAGEATLSALEKKAFLPGTGSSPE